MGFLGAAVVVCGIAVVSICTGALAFLLLRFPVENAAILAAASFLVLTMLQFLLGRGQDRLAATRTGEETRAALGDLNDALARLTNRVAALEGAPAPAPVDAEARAAAESLRHDLDGLAASLAAQAETVASFAQRAVFQPSAAAAPPPDDAPRRGRFGALPRAERVALVAEAIEAGRIELLLQPVVTLPQRRVRWYEAQPRLKTERGEVILADDAQAIAAEGGLSPRLDRAVLARAVQLVRRLQARNNEVGLTVDVAPATWAAGELFRDIAAVLDAGESTAALMLEVAQDAYRAFGPLEFEAMALLAARGTRFSLDRVDDLRLDGRELAERGFRAVKIPADILLGHGGTLPADIHPVDLAGMLRRNGIELVADRIEGESTVIDLLEFDVRFGQGYLFSPPRPVRAELLDDEDGPRARAAS